MTRDQLARMLAGVSALAFFVAGGLHASGYRAVVLQAREGFTGLAPLVAALWLAFAAAMLVLGGIVALVALGRAGGGRWILGLAGGFPLITVLLQLRLLGFTWSTAMLVTVAALCLAAAVLFPQPKRDVTG